MGSRRDPHRPRGVQRACRWAREDCWLEGVLERRFRCLGRGDDYRHREEDAGWRRDAATRAPARTSWPSTFGEMESRNEMNEYAQMAMHHWQIHRPSEYAQIPDPESHFAALGQQAQERAVQIEEDVVRSIPTSQDYLDSVARRNQARATAREIVLADLLLPPEETPETVTDRQQRDPLDGLIDPTGMPTDPNHPLWEDLENEAISPSEFQRRRKAWIASLPTR